MPPIIDGILRELAAGTDPLWLAIKCVILIAIGWETGRRLR